MLDVNKLCLNVTKLKFMIFQMPQKKVPQLSSLPRVKSILNPHVHLVINIQHLLHFTYSFLSYLKVLESYFSFYFLSEKSILYAKSAIKK